jgi:hypothetical protein
MSTVEWPVPVGSDHVGKEETQLRIHHKLGIGQYSIKDGAGDVLFEVRGPSFVTRDIRRMIADAKGNDIILLKNRVSLSVKRFTFLDYTLLPSPAAVLYSKAGNF